MLDAIIIGGGVAGLSALLWCDDLRLRAVLLERRAEIGGQLLWIHNAIENHLGTTRAANGRELRDRFAAQLAARTLDIRTNAEVAHLDATNETAIRVHLRNGEELTAQNVILATGLRRRQLGVEGEAEFTGRGVSASGTRDREQLAGKAVCVVGGGDAAVENALLLAGICPRVWLVHRGAELRARPEFVARIEDEPRITPLLETTVARIYGEERVAGVELRRGASAQTSRLAVEAVLVRVGYKPNTELVRGLIGLDAAGYACVTSEGETSVRGIFAIGDIANPRAPTISGAIGAGATVAKVIEARRRNR